MSGKIPFEEVKPIQQEAPGVKLKNKRQPNKRLEAPKEFQKRAEEHVEGVQDRNQRAFNLAKKFLDSIRDKTLQTNKTSINTDLETEMKNGLISLLIEVNNDETADHDGMGSATLVSLMLKGMLMQRDIINDLSYKVDALEKQLSSLSKSKP